MHVLPVPLLAQTAVPRPSLRPVPRSLLSHKSRHRFLHTVRSLVLLATTTSFCLCQKHHPNRHDLYRPQPRRALQRCSAPPMSNLPSQSQRTPRCIRATVAEASPCLLFSARNGRRPDDFRWLAQQRAGSENQCDAPRRRRPEQREMLISRPQKQRLPEGVRRRLLLRL